MANFIVTAIAGAAFAASFAGAVTVLAVNLALSYAVQKIFEPDAEDVQNAGDLGSTVRVGSDTSNKIPVVYGEKTLGGSVTMADLSSNKQTMAFMITLCESDIDGATKVTWRDKDLTFNGDINTGLRSVTKAVQEDGTEDDFLNDDRLKVRFYPNGGRCKEMEEFSAKWKDYAGAFDSGNLTQTNRRMPNIAYAYVELTYDREKRVTSLTPQLFFSVKGKKVKEITSTTVVGSTYVYSNNPADCFYDYLTNTRFGPGLKQKNIDIESVFNHKTFCNESKAYIDIAEVTQNAKRYTTNGIVDTKLSADRLISHLTVGNSSSFNWTIGKFGLITNKVTASTKSFSEDDIYGGIKTTGTGFNSKLNKLTIRFSDKQTRSVEGQEILEVPASNKNDNEPLLPLTVVLPFTNNNIEAKRAGTIQLNQSRQSLVVSFYTDLNALTVQSGDVITLNHKTVGFVNKYFRVLSVEETVVGGASGLKIVGQEYGVGVYDDLTINETDVAPNTELPNPFLTPVSPQSVAVTSELYTSNKASGVKTRVDITWADVGNPFVDNHTVEYKLSSDSVFTDGGTFYNDKATLYDFAAGTYDFKVVAQTVGDRASAPTIVTDIEILGVTANPINVSGFSLSASQSQALLSWNISTELDVISGGTVQIRHTNLLGSSATWNTAQILVEALQGETTSKTVPLLQGTYLAKFFDSGERESVDAAVVVNTLAPAGFNFVANADQEPSFLGTKTNCTVVSNKLRLDTDETVITYDFSSVIDLNLVKSVRVAPTYTVEIVNISDLVCNIPNVCDLTTFCTPQEDGKIEFFISTTQDDPSGTPTWTEYSRLITGNYSARGLRFRAVGTVGDTNTRMEFIKLGVSLDAEDTTITGSVTTSLTDDVTENYAGGGFYRGILGTNLPRLGALIIGGSEGDQAIIGSSSATSFTISVFNDGNRVVRNVDYQAIGQ